MESNRPESDPGDYPGAEKDWEPLWTSEPSSLSSGSSSLSVHMPARRRTRTHTRAHPRAHKRWSELPADRWLAHVWIHLRARHACTGWVRRKGWAEQCRSLAKSPNMRKPVSRCLTSLDVRAGIDIGLSGNVFETINKFFDKTQRRIRSPRFLLRGAGGCCAASPAICGGCNLNLLYV